MSIKNEILKNVRTFLAKDENSDIAPDIKHIIGKGTPLEKHDVVNGIVHEIVRDNVYDITYEFV